MNSIVPTCPSRSNMEIEMPSRRLDEVISIFTIVVLVVLSDGQPYGRWSSTRDASSMRNKRVVIADSVPLVSDVDIVI